MSDGMIMHAGAISRVDAPFGPGTTDQPILLDDVRCVGTEQRLFDCLSNGLEIHNCVHAMDAGVECLAGMEL